jgi:hypothetical protein
MPSTTKAGTVLADNIMPVIGRTSAIVETCSLIARHANSYARIQEIWCSVELSEYQQKYYEQRERWLENRIMSLVTDLPHSDDGPWSVEFSGDPRGYTVKLFCPEPSASLLRNSCTTNHNQRATGVA